MNKYPGVQCFINIKCTEDIIVIIDCFENRNDDEIGSMIADNTDILIYVFWIYAGCFAV